MNFISAATRLWVGAASKCVVDAGRMQLLHLGGGGRDHQSSRW